MAKRWYVIHTYSGHENKVKTHLEKLVAAEKLQEKISQVLVPTEEVVEMKQGKKTSTVRKLFPSYVLVEMEMDQDSWHLVTNAPGVTHFVGAGTKPQPLRESELDRILHRVEEGQPKKKVEVPFRTGDQIKVIDGPFTDFTGVVEEVHPERGKLKVMVSIFGRATPVELDFLQVAHI
ncbi:MAG: transcription termination/antitermination factor NusG [Candidatus Latescibacteria bacterium]|nr:transcription termination/antitermination factor NusG [Candidatus Latescibacterota bacterium]